MVVCIHGCDGGRGERERERLCCQCVHISKHTPPPFTPHSGIIISGGPNSVNDKDAPHYDPAIFKLSIPILGICYGLQLINVHYGGTVSKKAVREDGQFSIKIEEGEIMRVYM